MNSLKAEGVAKLVIVTDSRRSTTAWRWPRASAPPRRAGPHPARVPRDQGLHGHHLRPDLRHRKAPPPKRGKLATPTRPVVINELVCEGCGDCSVQSNCLSVEPVETEFGRKRRINQSTCNKGLLVREGLFAPASSRWKAANSRSQRKTEGRPLGLPPIPEPVLPVADGLGHRGGGRGRHQGDHHWLAAGHGGGHLEGQGRHHCRRPGLAQRAAPPGAIQIANRPGRHLHHQRSIPPRPTLVIGCTTPSWPPTRPRWPCCNRAAPLWR